MYLTRFRTKKIALPPKGGGGGSDILTPAAKSLCREGFLFLPCNN
jgi:hypothetical protein